MSKDTALFNSVALLNRQLINIGRDAYIYYIHYVKD